MENQSKYDPSRKTVGAIYREAQLYGDHSKIEAGDMTREVMSSLVDDLNDTIKSNPYDGKSFYITVHEKKDLQMKNALLRRMLTSLYRPYPEDDTVVFYVDNLINQVYFCWCLPHWSDMDNMLSNSNLFDKQMISRIKAWKNVDLYHFGFTKDSEGNWMPNPHYKDEIMKPKLIETPKILIA